MDFIEQTVLDRAKRYHQDLETACEAALQTGRYGVKVQWHQDGGYVISVDADVPYGFIHEHLAWP